MAQKINSFGVFPRIVNPRILSDSGGPCGDDFEPFTDEYVECVTDVKKQMITATALVSIFGKLLQLQRACVYVS